MSYLLTNLFGNAALFEQLELPTVALHMHTFPDEEALIRINGNCNNKNIFLFTSLHHPNAKILNLLLAAQTLREYGAKSIILVAPYLPYMRQDTIFHPGEGVTARYFAALLSSHFDGLITVDPHLHRFHHLSEIYTIPTRVVHAAPLIGEWIKSQIEHPILIGPDLESKQWVSSIGLPFIVLNKKRKSDTEVEIMIHDIDKWKNYTPVLVDDIISTGQTLIETCKHLGQLDFSPPVIVGIHGLFSQHAYEMLMPLARTVCTTNAIVHESNQIDISPIIIKAIQDWMDQEHV